MHGWRCRFSGFFLFCAINMTVAAGAGAMEIHVSGATVTMSGMVTGNECDILRKILDGSSIRSILLTNSIGGDADTGYCVGELIRQRGLNTIIKGYCISSCSRMWLGGVKRILDGDEARVGLHGHYRSGLLREDAPARLREWLPRHAPVDRELMEQWINLPRSQQVMFFFNKKASLCEKGTCTDIPNRNAYNAGLAN